MMINKTILLNSLIKEDKFKEIITALKIKRTYEEMVAILLEEDRRNKEVDFNTFALYSKTNSKENVPTIRNLVILLTNVLNERQESKTNTMQVC